MEPTILSIVEKLSTVEPPNKGHLGTKHFVLCREAVLLQRLFCTEFEYNGTFGLSLFERFVLFQGWGFTVLMVCLLYGVCHLLECLPYTLSHSCSTLTSLLASRNFWVCIQSLQNMFGRSLHLARASCSRICESIMFFISCILLNRHQTKDFKTVAWSSQWFFTSSVLLVVVSALGAPEITPYRHTNTWQGSSSSWHPLAIWMSLVVTVIALNPASFW